MFKYQSTETANGRDDLWYRETHKLLRSSYAIHSHNPSLKYAFWGELRALIPHLYQPNQIT